MPDTMREDFQEAFKKHEADEEQTEQEEQQVTEAKAEETPTAEESTVEASTEEASTEEAPAEEPEQDLNAPVSWSASSREHWNTLPDDVKQQVLKRENEIAKGLEAGKEYRKTGERFNEIVNKFQPIISAEGITDPIQGFNGLMETMAGLRLGTQQQKAQLIAKFIHGYGVDINELDNILSGQISGQQQQPTQNTQLEQLLEQKLAPVNQFMSTVQQQQYHQQQQLQENTNREVSEFGKTHEFYNDVRMEMADLIDLAANNGRELSLEQAYNMACASNPEIQKALQTRQNLNSMEQKRQAASSISGKQGGNATHAPETLRGALEQAWDA